MGKIANILAGRLQEIFENLDPNVTAEQKARLIAEAIERAILEGLTVEIPPGKVVIGATAAVMNPAPIECTKRS